MKSTVSNAYSKASRICTLAIAVMLCFTSVRAQSDTAAVVLRPVAAAYCIGIGSSHTHDTYLTPLAYSGFTTGLSYERMQAMKFDPDRWVMRLTAGIDLRRGENPVRNAAMWDVSFGLSWGMMRRWTLPVDGLRLYGGGYTAADVGALYLPRNGNNPVSAKAAWTVGVTGAAVWCVKVRRLPVCLRYQPSLPVTGVFFSPDYGELYYEIYLGNHKDLVHGAWWGNYFKMDNLLTADLRLGSTNLRVGYNNGIFSSKVNGIVTRHITHTFVVGISGEWMSLPRSGRFPDKSKIVSALY